MSAHAESVCYFAAICLRAAPFASDIWLQRLTSIIDMFTGFSHSNVPNATRKRICHAMKYGKLLALSIVLGLCAAGIYHLIIKRLNENRILKQIIERLEADSRVAEVLVTDVSSDIQTRKTHTTIKFLEYDIQGNPMKPKYFTFTGTIIQFQSLVIRFTDLNIRGGDRLKGKSVYLFWKAFMLDGANTQEFEITKLNEVPGGYEVNDANDRSNFETRLWQQFWTYALNPDASAQTGVKNAQIEAPGTMFVPGVLYTIRIEHDGGLRIDAQPLSPILRGESVP